MVLKPSKEFLQEALTNNSFDIDSTDKALRITLDHSFSYLYRLQRNMVCYEEYFYTTRNVVDQPDYGDLFMDARERICVNFPASLILQQYREKFRTSKYYRELVDYTTLKTDHTLFSRLPVILIDNCVLRSFQMDMYDDFFTAHLPFGRYFLHTTKYDHERKEYEFINHTMSLQVINNSFYEDIQTNSGMLMRNSYDEHSYDRILTSYAKDLGLTLDRDKSGTYFACVFKGDEQLGTQLQEVSFDQNGDILIHYDADALTDLINYTGDLTIRFYFYRYLQRYTSYHYGDNDYDINKLVRTRTKDEKLTSEIFLIQKEGNVNYQLPIPTENLLIFRSDAYKATYSTPGKMEHFPNANVDIKYPNIYRVIKGIKMGDKFSIYYFYMPPYDLHYDYMYQFYYNYLTYKWTEYSLEETINRIFFGTMDYIGDPAFEELEEVTAAVQALSLVSSGSITKDQAGTFYAYALTEDAVVDGDLETAKSEFTSGNVPNILSDEETPTIPTKIEEFAKIFDFVINHEIVGYYYDEMDYIRKYESTMHPFEYKVSKLKSFIKDDYKALTNYVRSQNKVGYKYEFSAEEIDLPSRYCTESENGEKFVEPMYLLTIQRPDPDDTLSARVFIDGLLCTCFIYDRYEFTDLIYVPVSQVNDDSYFEVEVFPRYLDEKVVTFSITQPSCEVEFPSTENVSPTISDIFFYLGEEDTLDRLDASKFELEFISTRYNYYVNPDTEIPIFYKGNNGVALKGPYWNEYGESFTFEGMRTPENDITTKELSSKVSSGELVQDVGYATDSHLGIIRLSDIVTYDKVAEGETTLQPDDNKGVLYSRIDKIRVTLKDISLYNQPITIGIAKKPAFEGSKLPTISYPSYTTPIENSQNVEEYTRAFKNGRLLSKNRYDFTVIDGLLGIQVLEKLNKGETIGFDISPYRNRLIYYKAELDSDLVDLRGYINKPFDPKFYEVYLNGRRLNRTNIYPISPWEFKLGGTHSIYNLEIYEKDRDWEYYGTDFTNYFTLSDFIRATFMEDALKEHLIHDETGDVPPNDNCEDRMPWERELDLISVYFEMFYYMKLVPMHFVSGDQIDFSAEEIKNKYPIIYQLYHKTNADGDHVLLLNPDVGYMPENPKLDEDGNPVWNTFLLGNPSLDNLDD